MGKPHTQRRSGGGGEDLPLHTAARNGNLNALIPFLASNPLAINSRDKHSRTPLHLAAWSGQTEVVDYLCKHKADVGAAAMDDMGAIHFAAQKGHLNVVRTLISFGGSVKSSTRKGWTPLHYAVQVSHIELVKYLVKKGGSLSAKTKAGMTPLDLAGKNEEIRSFLEQCQSSSNKGDLTDKDNAMESDPKPSLSEREENSGEVTEAVNDEEGNDEKLKRKSDEVGITETSSSEPKKPRIALNHLLSADEGQEDENNL